jgi:hypothetical protein
MRWTGRQRYVFPLLFCSMAAASGCAPTPRDVEEAYKAFHGRTLPSHLHHTSVITFLECREGERDWQFICRIQTEPTAWGLVQRNKPQTRRFGLRNVQPYRGRPFGIETALPLEGPIPSRAEVREMSRQETARVEAQIKKRSNEVVRPRQ